MAKEKYQLRIIIRRTIPRNLMPIMKGWTSPTFLGRRISKHSRSTLESSRKPCRATSHWWEIQCRRRATWLPKLAWNNLMGVRRRLSQVWKVQQRWVDKQMIRRSIIQKHEPIKPKRLRCSIAKVNQSFQQRPRKRFNLHSGARLSNSVRGRRQRGWRHQ